MITLLTCRTALQSSARPSPSLDRLLQHLVALAVHPNDNDEDAPPALELDLARRLLDWLRRLKAPKDALARGMAALGQEQGWSYEVVEGFRMLARAALAAAPVVAVATGAEGQEKGMEEEEEEEEI